MTVEDQWTLQFVLTFLGVWGLWILMVGLLFFIVPYLINGSFGRIDSGVILLFLVIAITFLIVSSSSADIIAFIVALNRISVTFPPKILTPEFSMAGVAFISVTTVLALRRLFLERD